MNTQQQIRAPSAGAKLRRLTVGYKPLKSHGVEVPYLRLRGRWLRDAGFEIGRHVKVDVREGRLTIERVD